MMAHVPHICLHILDSLQSQKQDSGLQPLCIPSKIPSIKPETSSGDASAQQCLFKDVMDRVGMKF